MVVKVECAECFTEVRVDVDAGTVTARVASNGRRGSLHVPAHDVTNDDVTVDDVLVYWECPVCDYADSTYLNPDDAP